MLQIGHERAQPTASRLTVSGVIFFTLPSVNFNDLQIKNTSKNDHYSAQSLSLNVFYQVTSKFDYIPSPLRQKLWLTTHVTSKKKKPPETTEPCMLILEALKKLQQQQLTWKPKLFCLFGISINTKFGKVKSWIIKASLIFFTWDLTLTDQILTFHAFWCTDSIFKHTLEIHQTRVFSLLQLKKELINKVLGKNSNVQLLEEYSPMLSLRSSIRSHFSAQVQTSILSLDWTPPIHAHKWSGNRSGKFLLTQPAALNRQGTHSSNEDTAAQSSHRLYFRLYLLSRGSTFKVPCPLFPDCTHSFCTTSSSFLHSLSHPLTLATTQTPLKKRLLGFSCQEIQDGTQCWDLHTAFQVGFKVPSFSISTDTVNMVRACQQQLVTLERKKDVEPNKYSNYGRSGHFILSSHVMFVLLNKSFLSMILNW